MNDANNELAAPSEDDDFELTNDEKGNFQDTLKLRTSNPITLSITSADDGFDVVFENQLIASDRGTASNHDIKIDLFELAKRNYFNSRVDMNSATAKIWRRMLRKLGAGRQLDLEMRCWNAGGPSQVTYTVSAAGGNSIGGRKVGTHNSGITFTGKYGLRFDRLLEKNYIVVLSEQTY